MIASVAIINNNRHIDSLYTYSFPSIMSDDVNVGSIVLVPFGKGDVIYPACVLDIQDGDAEAGATFKIKEIKRVIREIELTKGQVHLAERLRETYILTYGEALTSVFPSGIQIKAVKTVDVVMTDDIEKVPAKARDLYDFISENVRNNRKKSGKPVKCETGIDTLRLAFGRSMNVKLRLLQDAGLAEVADKITMNKINVSQSFYELDIPHGMKFRDFFKTVSPSHVLKRRILKYLFENERASYAELKSVGNVTRKSLETMVNQGMIKREDEESLRLPELFKGKSGNADFKLSCEQQSVFDAIVPSLNGRRTAGFAERYAVCGVTGSGKTNVYIQLCKEVVKGGKTCLILVPEISLTPQIVAGFNLHAQFKIAVFHSKLSHGEKIDQWRLVGNGGANVIIGARSAVFAPFNNLGIIIVDEEHDPSYRSQSAPVYDAREAAEIMADYEGIPVVYGSATPSLNMMNRINEGEVTRLDLTERYGDMILPECETIDMRSELLAGNKTILSRRLKLLIDEKLKAKEQVILYLNRKGHSTFVSCRQCGYVVKCEECDVSMTYYKGADILRCNVCGSERRITAECPNCKSRYFKYFGAGTEKIEEFIRDLYPDKNVQRLDSVVTSKKGSMEEIISSMERGDTDILIGTQLVSKGLDFPNIGLVGIITADTMLNIPDFISRERTFQLITQVSGRAGRGGKRANVIIQTYSPDDYSIRLAVEANIDAFSEMELKMRKNMMYPPFFKLIRLIFRGLDEKKTRQNAIKMYNCICANLNDGTPVRILGPGKAGLRRIRNRYEAGITVKYHYKDSDTDCEIKRMIRLYAVSERDKLFDRDIVITIDTYSQSLLF